MAHRSRASIALAEDLGWTASIHMGFTTIFSFSSRGCNIPLCLPPVPSTHGTHSYMQTKKIHTHKINKSLKMCMEAGNGGNILKMRRNLPTYYLLFIYLYECFVCMHTCASHVCNMHAVPVEIRRRCRIPLD